MSCSDIEKEIANLDSQATENAAAIADLNSKIAALQTALNAAQADADAAQKAADAAAAAAATAKADAIAAAKAEVEAAKAAIEAGVATDLAAVNAKVASVEAALALKADAATVELLAATLENYKATLSAEDTALWTSVSELLESLTNLQGRIDAQEMSVEDLEVAVAEAVEAVKAINTSLASVYDILGVLANQIQSVVFVPEYDTDVVYAQRYNVGTAKTNYIAVATYEVRPAKLAATVTSENVSFASVDVKGQTKAAAAPEYFAAEVISTDANTGRIVVAAIINDKDSKKNDNDYDVLANNKLALSLNIASVDVTELLIADSQPVNVDVVSSEYVNVVAKSDVALVSGFKSAKAFSTTYTNTIEMPYNTAVAESVKPLFTEPVMFEVAGQYFTAEQANAYLGTSLTVSTSVKAEYSTADDKNAAGKATVAPIAVNGKDINATATLVESADYPGDKAVGKSAKAALTVTVKNGKTEVAALALAGTATYTITNKKSDIAIASVSESWKYTYGKTMTVKGRELSVSNYDKFTEGQNLGTFTATWKEGDAEKSATTTVTAMSSKAVKFTDVVLPFTPGKATTYTFKNDKVVIGTTTYTVSFDVVLGAMPENTKVDLGTFTVTGDVANAQQVAVSPVAKAVEYIKNYDSTIAIEDAYTLTEVANVKGDGVTLNGKENAAAASMVVATALNEKNAKVREDKSYVQVAKVVDYVNTIVVVKTYEFCGVQFTYTTTVNTEKPAVEFTTNNVFVNNGVATIDGTVKLPVTKSKTSEVTGTSTAYALNAINLRDYVHVVLPKDAKENGYELRYTLVTPMYKEDGKTALYADVQPVAPVYNVVDAKRTGAGDQPLAWKVDLNELEYEIALVSSSRSTDRNEDKVIDAKDDVVLAAVNVKLQIPNLVTFAAENTVSAKYVNGVATTANVVEALSIVDKFNNNVYNPYATTLNDIFKGYSATLYNGKVQDVTFATDSFFNVYDMVVTAAEQKDVKVYLNNTEIAQTQVKFTYNQTTGSITLSEENANLTGDVKFEVPVTLTYMYDNYGKVAQKVTAVVVFSQNAEAGEGTEVSFPNPTGLQWVYDVKDAEGNVVGEGLIDFGVSQSTIYGFIEVDDLFCMANYEPSVEYYYAGWSARYVVNPTDASTGVITIMNTQPEEDAEGNYVAVDVEEFLQIAYSDFTGTTVKFTIEDEVFECKVAETPITNVYVEGNGTAPWIGNNDDGLL